MFMGIQCKSIDQFQSLEVSILIMHIKAHLNF